MTAEIQPLEAWLWLRRVEMIANGDLGGVENSLRHAAHLAQLAPRTFRPHVGLATDDHAFEALLDSGEFDGAARHLLPAAVNIEPEAGAIRTEVAVRSPLMNRTFHGKGETLAHAILEAWTACLLSLGAEFRPPK